MTVVRDLRAPAEVVFQSVADPRRFAQAIAGTRFRQTPARNGRAMTMEFAVTECVRNERLRIVDETHGTTWDSLFTVAPSRDGATLTMRMETRSPRTSTA